MARSTDKFPMTYRKLLREGGDKGKKEGRKAGKEKEREKETERKKIIKVPGKMYFYHS